MRIDFVAREEEKKICGLACSTNKLFTPGCWGLFVLVRSLPTIHKGGLIRGHRELLDGRLCRPDFEQWPWTSKIMLAQVHTKCIFHVFFVSSISYRPTDLSLLKEFSKNVSFWKFYIFHQIFPNRGLCLAILVLWL